MSTHAMVPVWREIHGEVGEVRAALETQAARGLLAAKPELRGWLDDGRIVVRAALLEPPPRARPVARRREVLIPVLSVAIVGMIVGAGWLVVTVVAWVAAHLAVIIGGLVVLLVLLALLAGSGKCPGLHCPGCGD